MILPFSSQSLGHSSLFSLIRSRQLALALCATLLACSVAAHAQAKPVAAPDTLVLSNGDILHGTFVNEINGTVTFHSDPLGDLKLDWGKIKELRTNHPFAVINKNVKLRVGRAPSNLPTGTVEVSENSLTIHPENGAALAPLPVKDVPFILDQGVIDHQVGRKYSIVSGWAGAATAGATLVTATQNQYTFSGGISLARVSPPIEWLRRRDRTSLDFTGSFGKITQPSYFDASGAFVPSIVTK